jgi:DNA-binding transcriptional MerR regulator/methylmalonyl-CoA mutase cobalamin-binding subunit
MEDRSPRYRIGQLATRTGVRPERLRAWESRYDLLEPQRSDGGFRLYSHQDEQRVRLMQRHLQRGFAAAEAAELARNGIVSPSPVRISRAIPVAVVERSFGLLRHAFEEFDESTGTQALDDLFAAYTVEAVLRDAIVPFLGQLGEAWAVGRATAGQEHFATALIQGRLAALARGWGTGSGPRALLACPACERHTLGLIIFGIALSRRGWRVTYLGEDTPAASLAHAARKVQPSIVVVAAAQARWFDECAGGLTRIGMKHALVIAGAGSGIEMAGRLGAVLLDADPVTAAGTLTPGEQKRPAVAGRV